MKDDQRHRSSEEHVYEARSFLRCPQGNHLRAEGDEFKFVLVRRSMTVGVKQVKQIKQHNQHRATAPHHPTFSVIPWSVSAVPAFT